MSLLLPGLQQSLWAIEAAAAGLVTVSAAAVLQISAGTRWARGGEVKKKSEKQKQDGPSPQRESFSSVHPGRATTEPGWPADLARLSSQQACPTICAYTAAVITVPPPLQHLAQKERKKGFFGSRRRKEERRRRRTQK